MAKRRISELSAKTNFCPAVRKKLGYLHIFPSVSLERLRDIYQSPKSLHWSYAGREARSGIITKPLIFKDGLLTDVCVSVFPVRDDHQISYI